jgi:hypothetical protein
VNIAVVGAPGTGKTTLVQTLRLALQADPDTAHSAAVTEDWLPSQPHHPNDLVLLMGNDLPHSSGEPSLPSDTHLRHTLDRHAITYAVVYGTGQTRTDCALQAIAYHRMQLRSRPRRAASQRASEWQWCCDTCSDAACEHRLFTALVKQPPGSVRP